MDWYEQMIEKYRRHNQILFDARARCCIRCVNRSQSKNILLLFPGVLPAWNRS